MIQLKNISKTYPAGSSEFYALNAIDLTIEKEILQELTWDLAEG